MNQIKFYFRTEQTLAPVLVPVPVGHSKMESHLEKVDRVPNKLPKKSTGPVQIIIFFLVICSVIVGPFLLFLSISFWLLASSLAWFYPEYGKFVGCYDVWMCEDFKGTISSSSIVSTLTLNGYISLVSLKRLFTENVLEAKQTGNTLRYPELKQYLTTFLGFRIWKKDSKFNIDYHISEKLNNQSQDTIMSRIHEDLRNKLYNKYRSPWEIVLFRNVQTQKSILAIRFHHGMADGKSILKLVVECLGEKSLKTANSQPSTKQGFIEWYLSYVLYPVHYFKSVCHNIHLGILSHPWKNHNLDGRLADGCVPWVVAFSPRLNLNDIKKVAKQYGVNTSAVVLALIAGGIRKFRQELGNQDVAVDLSMPRPGHPDTLANHFYFGSIILPTTECSTVKRLRKCQKAFARLKRTGFLELVHSQVMQVGMLLSFLANYFSYNYFITIAITNIAGDEDGFSVGNFPCTDFEMSNGIPGCGGLAVCFISYKDSVRIGVSTKENLMSHEDVDTLSTKISLELENLVYQK